VRKEAKKPDKTSSKWEITTTPLQQQKQKNPTKQQRGILRRGWRGSKGSSNGRREVEKDHTEEDEERFRDESDSWSDESAPK
jgi:hypothetical protein